MLYALQEARPHDRDKLPWVCEVVRTVIGGDNCDEEIDVVSVFDCHFLP